MTYSVTYNGGSANTIELSVYDFEIGTTGTYYSDNTKMRIGLVRNNAIDTIVHWQAYYTFNDAHT